MEYAFVMFKRFLITILIIFFPLSVVLAKVDISNPLAAFMSKPEEKEEEDEIDEAPDESPAGENKELEEEILEFTPFIDSGKAGLPMAPELISSIAEQEMPEVLMNNMEDEKSEKLAKIESEEDEQLAEEMDKLFGGTVKEEEEDEDEGQNTAAKEDTKIIVKAPVDTQPIEVSEEKQEETNLENKDTKPTKASASEPVANEILSEHLEEASETKAKEEKTETLQPVKLAANDAQKSSTELPAEAEVKKEAEEIKEDPQKPTAIKEAPPILIASIAENTDKPQEISNIEKPEIIVRKKKPKKRDIKLMRFIRDESIFILFKDDDIILGKLSERAKLDQMPFPEYLRLYKNSIKDNSGMEKSIQMEKFIKARSHYAHVPIKKSQLQKSVRKEIRSSNLSDLRTLDDHYEIIDMVLDNNGNTALHIATYEDNPAIVKWLIMRGAHLGAVNIDSITATDLASSKRNWKIFEMLETANEG